MSGLEALAVIGAIAAVITAYKDAGDLLGKLKLRRAKKQLTQLPSSLLEDTLSHAETTLEDQQKYIESRYGRDWNDPIAVAEIRGLQLQFMTAVVKSLKRALEDDNFNDFGNLVNDSHLRLLEVMETLLGAVKRRMEPTLPVSSATLPLASPSDRVPSSQDPCATVEYTLSAPRSLSSPQLYSATTRPFAWTDRSIVEEPESMQDAQDANTRQGSKAVLKERATSVGGTIRSRRLTYERKIGRALPPIRRPSVPAWTLPRTEDAASVRHGSVDAEANNGQQDAGFDVLDATSVWAENSIAQAVTPRSDQEAHVSLTLVRKGSPSIHMACVKACEDNNFLGLCKGAVGMQLGHSNTFRTSDYVLYFYSVPYDHCSHCGFVRWLDKEKVQVFLPGRIQYRWSFLAKCHVPLAGKRYDHEYGYKCSICALSGRDTPTIFGADWLLKHVAMTHHGERMGPDLLQQTQCVNDHIADSNDSSWDINLVPEADEMVLRATYARARALALSRARPMEVSYLPSLKWFKREQRQAIAV